MKSPGAHSKLLNVRWKRIYRFFAVFVCVLSLAYTPLLAHATIYQPGETLEPDCAPESLNCGVATSTTSFELNGQGVATQSFATTTSGTDFTIISSGGVHTFSFPDASALARGLVTFGSQVFAGDKTFNDGLSVLGAFTASGDFVTTRGSDYPTTGTQNNVNLGTGSVFNFTGVAPATFTGFVGGVDGRQIRLINNSSFAFILNHEDTGSTASNRILISSGVPVSISQNGSVTLLYDSSVARWRLVQIPASSSIIGTFAFLQNGNAYGTAASLGTTDANPLNFLTSGFTRFTVATSSASLIGNGATAITGGTTLALASAAGSALTITSGTTGAVTLDSGSTGAVNVGTGSTAKTVTIGNTTGASALNLLAGSGGINLTGLFTAINASTTLLSILNGLYVGTTATSSIVGNGGLSTLRSDLLVTGSTTLQNFTATNATTTGTHYAGQFVGDVQLGTLARIGNSTFSTLQDLQNVFHSAGYTSGGAITDMGGGVVSVDAGTGLLRPTNSAISTIFYADWTASTSISIPTDTVRYIGVEYNAGSPRVTTRTSPSWNYKTDFPLGVVANENGTIHIINDVQGVGDHASNMIWREYETMPLSRDERDGGLMLEESGDGNRNIMLSEGVLWERLTRYPIDETDTSGAGTFDSYVGMMLETAGETQWDNTSYNNAGTLTALDPSKYAVLWFYVETDSALVMVYGTNQYSTVAGAVAEEEPMDLPLRLTAGGKLVGRLIFQKDATTAVEVDSAFNMNQFNSTALSFLSNLQGLDYASSGLTGFVASEGVAGGQLVIGGTDSADGLTLQSTATTTSTTDFIKFLVGDNGATEAVRITHDGNVGIGTTTPSTKLSVAGETLAQKFTTYSSADTSAFAGGVTVGTTLGVTGLTTLGNLTVNGLTSLQNFTGVNSTTTNATTTNLAVSGTSQLGTILSGLWNGTVIGAIYGGTAQTTWVTGDVLYASAADTLSRLPIGAVGTVLTVGVGGTPTWAPGGSGSGSDGKWATTTNNLVVYPTDPTRVVLIGASATTTTGNIFEVTGDSLFTGGINVTGLATLLGGASTTALSLSSNLYVGGNATTTASGAFTTNGLITAAGAGTGLSVTNNASINGLATVGNLFATGSSTLQNVTAINSTTTNATTTNLYATNFVVDNFSPANLSTGGTLGVTGLSTLSGGASTTNITASGAVWIGGMSTTTNGIVNTATKYQINGTDVLTSNTLGSGILTSSLTSLGTLGSLAVSGHSSLGTASSTALSTTGGLFVGGSATTTNGVTNVASKYQINGTDVLTSNTLGSGILTSSLTSLGTLGSLTVSGLSTLGNASTTVLSASTALFVGSASIASNGNINTSGTITSGLINGQTISSSANFTGSLTVASLLTASNGLTVSSGTITLPTASIADAALSSNVALLDRSGQTFSGTNTFSSLTTLGNASTTQISVSGNSYVSGSVVTPRGSDYPTTGLQNDVDFGAGTLFRYTGVGTATFTGIAGGVDGRFIRIINASASNLTISNESVSSTEANRITTATGADLTLASNVAAGLQYDSGTSRWRVVVLPATSATVGGFAFVQSGNAFGTTATLGTTDANTLALITGGATRFTLASGASTLTGGGATTLAGGSTLALTSAAGSALTLTSGTTGAITLDSGTTGIVNIGTGTSGKAINIGTNNTAADTIAIGSALDAFSITSTGLNVTTGGALTGVSAIDTITHSATAIGFVGTGALTSGAGTALTFTSGTTGAVTIDSGTTGIVNLGTGNNAKTINLGTGTAGNSINVGTNNTVADTIAIGSALDALSLTSTGLNVTTGGALTGVASIDTITTSATAIGFAGTGTVSSAAGTALNITAGTTGVLTLDSGSTGALNFGTGANAKTITIGNTTGATALSLQSGTGNIGLQVAGTGTVGNVQIGAGGAGSATPDLFVLDTKSTAGDPTGTNGAMYYNENTDKFRCFENGAWANCLGTGTDIQHAASYDTTEANTNITSTQVTVTSVSVTPSTATGDVYIRGKARIISGNNTDQSLVLSIEDNGTCTGSTLVTNTITITSANGVSIGDFEIAAIEVDAGASSQSYSLCASTATGDTDINLYELFATVIDTGADYAEIYTTNDETLEAGDVVAIDPTLETGVHKSSGVNDYATFGIVSTRPGVLVGGVTDEGVKAVPVALSGRVPVKVTSENGPIMAGDFLTPSSIAGVAMKSNGQGVVVGQAMAPYDSADVGFVLAFVRNFVMDGGSVLGGTAVLDGTSEGLTAFITAVQSEDALDVIATITEMVTSGKQLVANVIAARITAIRGYFDELFTNKIHTEELCVKKSDGTEVCVNGDQLQEVLDQTGVVGDAGTSTPTDQSTNTGVDEGTSTPNDTSTTTDITSDGSTSTTGDISSTEPAPEPTPDTTSDPAPEVTPEPDPVPESVVVPEPEPEVVVESVPEPAPTDSVQ